MFLFQAISSLKLMFHLEDSTLEHRQPSENNSEKSVSSFNSSVNQVNKLLLEIIYKVSLH